MLGILGHSVVPDVAQVVGHVAPLGPRYQLGQSLQLSGAVLQDPVVAPILIDLTEIRRNVAPAQIGQDIPDWGDVDVGGNRSRCHGVLPD